MDQVTDGVVQEKGRAGKGPFRGSGGKPERRILSIGFPGVDVEFHVETLSNLSDVMGFLFFRGPVLFNFQNYCR